MRIENVRPTADRPEADIVWADRARPVSGPGRRMIASDRRLVIGEVRNMGTTERRSAVRDRTRQRDGCIPNDCVGRSVERPNGEAVEGRRSLGSRTPRSRQGAPVEVSNGIGHGSLIGEPAVEAKRRVTG